jgi:opacity protein-like surface antigen
LDRGYNIGAGVGANLTDRFGLMVDFTFNDFGINRSTLDQLQVPDGHTRIWGLTLNPIVYLAPSESTVNFYITGGGGLYRRTIEFTQPAVQTITAFDPWWGYFYPANVPTNLVLGSFSVMKGGLNGGAGLTVRLGSSNVKLFAEARYHHMFTPQIDTNFVPVTFGFRW